MKAPEHAEACPRRARAYPPPSNRGGGALPIKVNPPRCLSILSAMRMTGVQHRVVLRASVASLALDWPWTGPGLPSCQKHV